jgi:integrase
LGIVKFSAGETPFSLKRSAKRSGGRSVKIFRFFFFGSHLLSGVFVVTFTMDRGLKDERRTMGRSSPFIVTRLVLKQGENRGERLPLLLRRASRLPVARPMEWALTLRRAVPISSASLDRELRHVALFEWWLENEGMTLNDPMAFADAFLPSKIEASLRPWMARDQSDRKVKKLSVAPEEIRDRLAVTKSYVDWSLNNAQRALSVRIESKQILALQAARASILKTLDLVSPTQCSQRLKAGLTPSDATRLIEVIDPNHPKNPWGRGTSKAAGALRHRNQLIVLLMLAFGPRRGDVLKLHTGDAKAFGADPTLWIRRRPDDPGDPRVWEPNAKTEERVLPLDPSLARTINDYINNHRVQIPKYKRSPYLFLASQSGTPLSSRSVNEIFEMLKPEFPGIHPHVLRHTHNDRLVEHCARSGIDPKDASNHAKYLNGWLGDNLGIYTQRSQREAAHRISKVVQRNIFAPLEDVPF